MPVKTACPACHAPYTLADSVRGKNVRCKQCQEVFAVPAVSDPELAIRPEAGPATRPAGAARVRGGAAPPPLAAEDTRTDQLPRRRREPVRDGEPRSNALL